MCSSLALDWRCTNTPTICRQHLNLSSCSFSFSPCLSSYQPTVYTCSLLFQLHSKSQTGDDITSEAPRHRNTQVPAWEHNRQSPSHSTSHLYTLLAPLHTDPILCRRKYAVAIAHTHQQRWRLRSLRRGLAPAAMLVWNSRCRPVSLNGASIPSALPSACECELPSQQHTHVILTHTSIRPLIRFFCSNANSLLHLACSRTSVCTPHVSISVVAVLLSVGVGAVDGARIYMLGEQVQAREAAQLYNDAAVCNSHVVVGSTE